MYPNWGTVTARLLDPKGFLEYSTRKTCYFHHARLLLAAIFWKPCHEVQGMVLGGYSNGVSSCRILSVRHMFVWKENSLLSLEPLGKCNL